MSVGKEVKKVRGGGRERERGDEGGEREREREEGERGEEGGIGEGVKCVYE